MATKAAAERLGSTEAIMRVRRLCSNHPAFKGVEIVGDSLVVVVTERHSDPRVDEWELIDGTTSGGWPVRVVVRDGVRYHHGERLVPGWNVDVLDIAAGLKMAAKFGYDDPESQFVVEYALMRRLRGEEDGAQRTALSGGIDLTSWFAILAAATVVPT